LLTKAWQLAIILLSVLACSVFK